MKIIIQKKVGKTDLTFNVEDQDELQAMSKAGFFSGIPDKCKICESENVHLSSNKAQGYTFVKVICKDCNARSQMGQYKDGGSFWKEWEKYVPPAKKEESQGN